MSSNVSLLGHTYRDAQYYGMSHWSRDNTRSLSVTKAFQPQMDLTQELECLELTQKSHWISSPRLLSGRFEEWFFWAWERMNFQKGIYYRFIGDSLTHRKQIELFSKSESREMCCHGDAHLGDFHRTDCMQKLRGGRGAVWPVYLSPPPHLYKMSMYLSIQVAGLRIVTHTSTSSWTFLACLPLVSTESKPGHEAMSLSGMLLASSAKDENQNCSFSRSLYLSVWIISIFCYHCHFLCVKGRIVIQSSMHGKSNTWKRLPSLKFLVWKTTAWSSVLIIFYLTMHTHARKIT